MANVLSSIAIGFQVPAPAESDLGRAVSLLRSGDVAAANEWIPRLPPGSERCYLEGLLALGEGRHDAAKESFAAAARASGPWTELHLAAATAAFALRDARDAARFFQAAVDACATNLGLLARAGTFAFSQGWHAQAEMALGRLLQIDHSNDNAPFLLASAIHAQGRWEEAVDLYEKLLERNPGNLAARRQLALAQTALGWVVDALETWEIFANATPDDAEAHAQRARMRFQIGQPEKAAAARQAYLRATGHQKPVRFVLAETVPPRDWCARRGAPYETLIAARDVHLPAPSVIPATESTDWSAAGDGRMNEVFLARIPNAEVFPPQFSICTDDDTLLLDGLVTTPSAYLEKGSPVACWKRDGEVLLERAAEPRRIRETCALLGGNPNHFHWTWEAAARLMLLQREGLRELPVILTAGLSPFQNRMLDLLGVAPERRIVAPVGEGLTCDDLWVPSLVTRAYVIPREPAQFLREQLALPESRMSPRRRLYLSRNRSGRRMLANEEELLPLLHRAGFETLYPETLDFDQARQLFAEAAVILSIDGAALANLYMAPRSTRIGVIAVDGLPIPHYYYLASALGQPFTYLQGIPVHASHENAAHRDVTLPARDLATFLDSL